MNFREGTSPSLTVELPFSVLVRYLTTPYVLFNT